MKLNLILLPQLLCAIHKVSGSLHLSKTTWLNAHKMLVYSIRVSQGSVVTCIMFGGIFNDSFIANFLHSVLVKEF